MSGRVLSLRWMALTLLACAGCTPIYTPAILDVRGPEAMPFQTADGPVEQGADPFEQRDRQVEWFEDDLGAQRVLPVLVSVRNRSERAFLLRPSDVLLELSDGTRISAASPSAVASRLQRRSLNDQRQVEAAKRYRLDREADLAAKGLPEKRLGHGDSAQGFLFFIPPSAVQPFAEATLEFRYVDVEQGFSFVVPLPLVLRDAREFPPAAE